MKRVGCGGTMDIHHVQFSRFIQVPIMTGSPSKVMVSVQGLNTVALGPWNKTARSPAHSLFTDNREVLRFHQIGGQPRRLVGDVVH